MESEECPNCKSTKYRNPSMKLMVNVCGHPLCETCVEKLFARGTSTCVHVTCSKLLKKADFRYQVFEDSYIEKEIAIRKKILKDFDEKEEDFLTLREFNDYLEKIETFIYNLANNYEEEKTMRSIEDYKSELKQKHSKTKSRIQAQIRENPLFVYKPFIVELDGPKLPTDDLLKQMYIQHIVPKNTSIHRAGGFLPIVPVKRQIQEAFSGLFTSTKH